MIEYSYPLTNFQNSKVMEIHGTYDGPCWDLWNDKRIAKIFDWIMESHNLPSSQNYIYNFKNYMYNYR